MAAWAELPFLCIDTETTGVNPFVDRIVSAAAVRVDPDGSATVAWQGLFNPGIPIPEGATEVHGITTAQAEAEGMSPFTALRLLGLELWSHIEIHEGQAAVVMFNARFDWPLVLTEAARHDVDDIPCFAPILDPYLLDRLCDRYRKGKRQLTLVADHYGVELGDQAHGAVPDAAAAGRVLREMVRRYPKLATQTLGQLWLRQTHGHEELRRDFVAYMRRSQKDPGWDTPAGWPVPLEVQ